MRLLITGGAGYIGAHVVLSALERGCKVTVFDDLSSGSEENINSNTTFEKGSVCSKSQLVNLFKKNNFDAVIHLAAFKAAGESMNEPIEYAENNIIGGINLSNICLENGIDTFVFSSSAAVYGETNYNPVDEKHPLLPNNYYGHTKLTIENNLIWFTKLKNIRCALLRYFNAAGYDPEGRVCGLESNPQNLIPIVMESAIGIKPHVNIFGNDYNTKDGTGVRDYIHVSDLAKAHIDAIEYIINKRKNLVINLGSETGYSVLEVINKTKKISKQRIKYKFKSRRPGDADKIIADTSLAIDLIDWKPKYSDLGTIIQSTWDAYNKD